MKLPAWLNRTVIGAGIASFFGDHDDRDRLHRPDGDGQAVVPAGDEKPDVEKKSMYPTFIVVTSATARMSGMIVPKSPNAPAISESENFSTGFSSAVIASR